MSVVAAAAGTSVPCLPHGGITDAAVQAAGSDVCYRRLLIIRRHMQHHCVIPPRHSFVRYINAPDKTIFFCYRDFHIQELLDYLDIRCGMTSQRKRAK